MEPLNEYEKQLIVNSIKKVFDKNDISCLSKRAYDYLYLCSGFIAHYSIHGFRCYYSDIISLSHDILHNVYFNQYKNFHPSDKDYEYYMSKKDVYNRIIPCAEKFMQEYNKIPIS